MKKKSKLGCLFDHHQLWWKVVRVEFENTALEKWVRARNNVYFDARCFCKVCKKEFDLEPCSTKKSAAALCKDYNDQIRMYRKTG